MTPVLILFIVIYGALHKVNIYEAMSDGIKEGLRVCKSVFPAMVIMLSFVAMFRASGAADLLAYAAAPAARLLGIPESCMLLALLRPFTGGGALSIGSEIIARCGPDSLTGRVAAVMLGSSETSFYTVAVYSAYLGIKNTGYTLPAALSADAAAFIMSGIAVRLLM